MSEKRKFESSSDSDSESETNNDLKRKPEDLSIDDEERNELKRLEDKYNKRYTPEDEEYIRCHERPESIPPILVGYYGKNKNRDNDRYGQRGRGGYQSGGHNYRQNSSYDNRNSYQRPYNRY